MMDEGQFKALILCLEQFLETKDFYQIIEDIKEIETTSRDDWERIGLDNGWFE